MMLDSYKAEQGYILEKDFSTLGSRPSKTYLSKKDFGCFPGLQGFEASRYRDIFFGWRPDKNHSSRVELWTNGAAIDRCAYGLEIPKKTTKGNGQSLFNYLRSEERRFILKAAGHRPPWECSIQSLTRKIKDLDKEAIRLVSRVYPGVMLSPRPHKTNSFELYIEYLCLLGRREEVLLYFEKNIVPVIGLKNKLQEYDKEASSEGCLATWTIMNNYENPDDRPPGEKIFLKLYLKGDHMRIEYRVIHPGFRIELYPDNIEQLLPEMRPYAESAERIFNDIHANLNLPAMVHSREKLVEVLRAYGLPNPNQPTPKIADFIQQITEYGIYHPSSSRNKDYIIRQETIKKFANDEWGILIKDYEVGLSGKTKRVLYRLRPDWELAGERYLAAHPQCKQALKRSAMYRHKELFTRDISV